jgi:integrase
MARQRHQNGWLTEKSGNWYGHFNLYVIDPVTKKEKRVHKSVVLGPKSNLRKWEAEDKLRGIVKTTHGVRQGSIPDPETTFGSFVETIFFPMWEGQWSPATKQTMPYSVRHYLVSEFGDRALSDITETELQIFLNNFATHHSRGPVVRARTNLKAIMRMARKKRYIQEDPAEDLMLPRTYVQPTPTMPPEQLASLFAAIEDPMDKCLLAIAIFCALRSAEVFGLTWSSYYDGCLEVHSTSWKSIFYPDNAKTEASREPIPVADDIQVYIEQWCALCPDTSPQALMFSRIVTKGRNKGKVAPYDAFQFMCQRIKPIAVRLGIPPELASCMVFRRSAMTDLQKYGSVKDLQRFARHADAATTMNKYVKVIPMNVRKAANARTKDVLACTPATAGNAGVPARADDADVPVHGTIEDLQLLQRHMRNASAASTLDKYMSCGSAASAAQRITRACDRNEHDGHVEPSDADTPAA